QEALKAMTIEEVETLAKQSPYFKATADDIDWVSKVRLQGAIQKWVDHSISVTVNLPNNATEELVSKVYQTAWESGCKGITVYRDGCRDGVLISAKESDKKPKTTDLASSGLKRPIELDADVVRFTNGKESWIAFVGLYNNRPYEIFTGKIEEDALLIPKYVKHGKLVKVKEIDGNKRYDFKYTDNYGYPNFIGGISRMFNEEFWNYAKLISGVLRNGMPIVQVVTLVSSLHFDSDFINTWKNGVARALSKYVPSGTKVSKQCSECGEEAVVFQEGCLVCTSCGHSKCP
ncbi:MAG: ribonucleoside-diphosphate reductase, adenosylcobalamin-dependent, partial [Rikenellaceae bacterium]